MKFEILTKEFNVKEGFTIAFNPEYMFEGLNIMEKEDAKNRTEKF